MPNLGKLISVFEETRELLADPDNDFTWSSWEGREDALREMDGILLWLWCGLLPKSILSMTVLYAPTGPIQEVSLSSGWGNEFLALADRFDEEIELAVASTEIQAKLEILRTEELELATWLQDVRREIEPLQKQLDKNAGDFQINETAKRILVLLNSESECLFSSDLAPKLQMDLYQFKYYIKELVKLDYVHTLDSYESRESCVVEDIYYRINQKGCEYLKENGLI